MRKDDVNSQRSTSSRGVATGKYDPSYCPKAAGKNGTSAGAAPPESLIQSPIKSRTKTTVLIVHYAPLIRVGLAGLINASERFAVCAQTDDVPRAREMFVKHQPQLIVLGLTLIHGDGIELIKDFRRLNGAARILLLSAREDPLSIQRAFRAGAHGYLTMEDNASEIVRALDQIVAGYLYTSSNVSRRLLENLANGEIESARSELKPVSDRELQVFSLIGRGFGASRLATELHLSVKTIETYQTHIKEKLGLHSAAELSAKASRWTMESARRNLQLTNQASSRL
jgi:DNA-binding NarL/FixJ family response regulator